MTKESSAVVDKQQRQRKGGCGYCGSCGTASHLVLQKQRCPGIPKDWKIIRKNRRRPFYLPGV